jgi:hypothetical protein
MLLWTNKGIDYRRKLMLLDKSCGGGQEKSVVAKPRLMCSQMRLSHAVLLLSVWMAGSSVQVRNAEVDPLGGSRTC